MSFGPARGCLLVCAAGCMPYSAQIDRQVVRGDVSAHVQSLRAQVGREVRMTLVLDRVPSHVRLLDASVGKARHRLCDGPQRLQAVGREPERGLDEPLVHGERLTLGFGGDAFRHLVGAEQPRVDLLLATPLGNQRCIPLPLSEQGPIEWQPERRWSFGFGFSLEGFTQRLGSVSQIVIVPLELGVWTGDYHWELGAGIGGAGCKEELCEVTEEDTHIDYSTIFPLYVGVRRPLVSWKVPNSLPDERHGLGVALRYRAMKLAADTFSGREQFWMHGPVLMPYWGAFGELPEGLANARSPGNITVELPVGYAFANGQQTLTLGVGLSMFFTVL